MALDDDRKWISGVTILAGFTATVAAGVLYALVRWTTGSLPTVA